MGGNIEGVLFAFGKTSRIANLEYVLFTGDNSDKLDSFARIEFHVGDVLKIS